MTKLERINSVLAGAQADRPPASFWRHFYREEQTAEGLATAMVGFQRRFDWDFVKVNPRASYHAEALGCEYRQRAPDAKPEMFRARIRSISDWASLRPVPPKAGALGDHLRSIGMIRESLGDDIHILMTIFNPVSIVGELCGDPRILLAHFNEHPEAVRGALNVITETFVNFAEASLESGASGIFFATTLWATSEFISWEQYQELAAPLDAQFLEKISGKSRFTLCHVCRPWNFLRHFLEYPVHAFSWDSVDPTNPLLSEIAAKSGKAVVGGLDQSTAFTESSPRETAAEVRALAARMRGTRWILGAGCVIPTDASGDNLQAIRNVLDSLNG